MKTYVITTSGTIEEQNIVRRDVTQQFPHIKTRDLRPIFSPLQVATILSRDHVAIINLGFIKALLTQDRVFLFVHRKEDRIIQLAESLTEKPSEEKTLPFAFHALEKILEAKMMQIKEKADKRETETHQTLARLKKNITEKNLEGLLAHKKSISKIDARVGEIQRALEDLIDDEENIQDLAALSGHAKIDDTIIDELESILENAMEQVEDIAGHAFRLAEDIEDTEEYVTLKLNARRTAIIRADLLATITTLIFSFLAVIVGLYGVNIRNGLENDIDAFMRLKFFLILLFIGIFVTAFYFLKRKRLF